MGDHIILVDFLDREIGYEEKMKAHVRPMLHRAFPFFCIMTENFFCRGGLSANTIQGDFGPIPVVPTRGGEKRFRRRWNGGCWRKREFPVR